MISPLRRTSVGLALLALAGCSSSVVTVKGKLIKNGSPMVVSEDTYVTLSFILESPPEGDASPRSYTAKFDQKTGAYNVELPPGKYQTMLVIALPTKKDGKLNAPTPPIRSDKAYDLNKSQELNIEVPGK